MRRPAALLLAGLTLAACAQPKPAGEEAAFDARVKVPGIYGVRVEAVDGRRLALPMGRLLARTVAESMEAIDLPATTERARQNRYVLKGRAAPNTTRPDVKFIVVIHWRLTLADGTEVGTYDQGVEGAWWQWENGDPRLLRAIGSEAARPIAALVRTEEARAKAAPRPQPAIGLLLSPVLGAPGEGNAALTLAIRDALQAEDVTVTSDSRDAVARLQGEVSVTPGADGQDEVRIVWTLWTLEGEELGRAIQENRVPKASLAGTWSGLAPVVARGATQGILRVFDLTAPARGEKPSSAPPPVPVLPRAPGRALPPSPG